MIIDPSAYPTGKLFGLLTTAIAPRPICFASTIDAAGNVNLSPYSFFNVFGANPVTFVFSPSRRVRDGSIKHTLENLREVGEVSINIVNHRMVEQMSLASTEYAKGVNEFTKAGFTEVASEMIRPPRVAESPVSFECVLDRIIESGNGPGSGNLVIARAVRIHVRDEFLDEKGYLDNSLLDLVGRMGGNDYLRATEEAKFEIPKPLARLGIGVDALPEHIRLSTVLTGNNLGRLGNQESTPAEKDILRISRLPEVTKAREQGWHAVESIARNWLATERTADALALLWPGQRAG